MTDQAQNLYANLTDYRADRAPVWVVNTTKGNLVPSVAHVPKTGMAGGAQMPTVKVEVLGPGLNQVPAGWVKRVKEDAGRQRKNGGGVLAQMLDSGRLVLVGDIEKTHADKVEGWLMHTSNPDNIDALRSSSKHGEAAQRAWDRWHQPAAQASNEVRFLRHIHGARVGKLQTA